MNPFRLLFWDLLSAVWAIIAAFLGQFFTERQRRARGQTGEIIYYPQPERGSSTSEK
mgnify:CR=1 FL=1